VNVAVVGAGFSGSVIARQLAEAGIAVEIFESREHIGGNCYTERHVTGTNVHRYGPHIFHTGDLRVWEYICRFGEFVPFQFRVFATAAGRVYPLPINLLTINQVFGTSFTPREAQEFIASKSVPMGERTDLEAYGRSVLGDVLYERFFEGYTTKQWGVAPSELPASILQRLPVRFDYDTAYYSHPIQAIPRDGYTPIFEQLLDHRLITVHLNTKVDSDSLRSFDHIFWTGPLDAWFGHSFGRLRYRTLDFVEEVHNGDFQGSATMNQCDLDVPFTRTTEFNHFTPWEAHEQTVIYREFSRECGEDDTPYYPLRLNDDSVLLDRYLEAAKHETGVTFVGRLGTYRYLDMDVCIGEALDVAAEFLRQV
jgi:UDP-galactopyranose mutase